MSMLGRIWKQITEMRRMAGMAPRKRFAPTPLYPSPAKKRAAKKGAVSPKTLSESVDCSVEETCKGSNTSSQKTVDASALRSIVPFVASATSSGFFRERYTSCCPQCYADHKVCSHFEEKKLTLLFIGHNPSDHTWNTGFPYSNPVNRFWHLLRDSTLIPKEWTCADSNRMPSEIGIGFTDLGLEPGNEANAYDRKVMSTWTRDLYRRLQAHMVRIYDQQHEGNHPKRIEVSKLTAFAPSLVAFTGKRQWGELFHPPLKKIPEYGPRPSTERPVGWPFPPSTEVWVLPSSSGRFPISNAGRLQPYAELAQHVHSLRRNS